VAVVVVVIVGVAIVPPRELLLYPQNDFKLTRSLCGRIALSRPDESGDRRRRACHLDITAALVVPAKLLVRKSIGYPKKYRLTSTIL